MPGARQRIAADGARGDRLGRRQVLLHQRRRHGEHVADVVEAVARSRPAGTRRSRGNRRRADRESCWRTPPGSGGESARGPGSGRGCGRARSNSRCTYATSAAISSAGTGGAERRRHLARRAACPESAPSCRGSVSSDFGCARCEMLSPAVGSRRCGTRRTYRAGSGCDDARERCRRSPVGARGACADRTAMPSATNSAGATHGRTARGRHGCATCTASIRPAPRASWRRGDARGDVLCGLGLDARLLQEAQIAEPVDEPEVPGAERRAVAILHSVGVHAVAVDVHLEIRNARTQESRRSTRPPRSRAAHRRSRPT